MKLVVYIILCLSLSYSYGQESNTVQPSAKTPLKLLIPKRIYTTINDIDTRSIDKRRQNGATLFLDRMLFNIPLNPSCRFAIGYQLYSWIIYTSK